MEDSEFAARRLLSTIADRVNFRFTDEQDRLNFKNSFNLTDAACKRLDDYRQRSERKEAKQARDRWIERLQEQHAGEAVEQFLKKHFKAARDAEKKFIREQIGKEVKLQIPTAILVSKISSRRAYQELRSKIRKRRLRQLLHAWAATKALIGIGFVLLIYDKLQTDFEIIICSVLIRLYTQVIRATWWLSLTNANFNYAGYVRYIALKETFGFDTKPDEHKGVWDLEDGIKKSAIRFRVVDGGNSIIYLIVYWHLVKLLL